MILYKKGTYFCRISDESALIRSFLRNGRVRVEKSIRNILFRLNKNSYLRSLAKSLDWTISEKQRIKNFISSTGKWFRIFEDNALRWEISIREFLPKFYFELGVIPVEQYLTLPVLVFLYLHCPKDKFIFFSLNISHTMRRSKVADVLSWKFCMKEVSPWFHTFHVKISWKSTRKTCWKNQGDKPKVNVKCGEFYYSTNQRWQWLYNIIQIIYLKSF